METRMDRSDVDMMLGIAPCQDCDDKDHFPVTPIIQRQYGKPPLPLIETPHPRGVGRPATDNMHPVDLAWREEMGEAA